MTVARTGAHQCAADDGSDSDGGSNNCDDCDCASAAAVATAAASSTFAAVLCCCLPAGASPLYTVCRHTHAYTHTHTCFCFYFIALYVPHTHTHTHANIQFMHAPVCVSCLPTRRVCNANRAAQRSAVTKPKRRWAAAATATAAEQHNSRYRRILRCLLSQNFTFSR